MLSVVLMLLFLMYVAAVHRWHYC